MTDLILICFLILNAWIGFKRGLVKTVLGLTSTIMSFLLTAILYRPFSELLYSLGWGGKIKIIIAEKIQEKTQQPLLSGITEQAAELLSQTVLNVISFILVIICVKVLLAILLKVLDVVAKIPVIKQANSLFGMFAGLAFGALLCYIIIGILSAINNSGGLLEVRPYIENSYFVSLLYEENILKSLLSVILR